MPKTLPVAITSPAGTADNMEVLTNVTPSSKNQQLLKKEGGWHRVGRLQHK